MKKKILDRPEKVRTSTEELEVLLRLKESVEWSILKRWIMRYISHLKSVSFKLLETDAHYLAVRHAEFAGQALSLKELIKAVENSGKRLEKEDVE
jgi:hypothetical protein